MTEEKRFTLENFEGYFMSDINKAFETQLKNIQTKTNKTLVELTTIIQNSGLVKHGEIRDMLKRELSLGHGDANTLAHFFFKSRNEGANEEKEPITNNVLDEIYTGAKAQLRPIHDKLMEAIREFGEFEIAPKKGYISLRRKKQFAMIGPATNTRIEVGLNIKDLETNIRLNQMPPNSMCHYKVKLTDIQEVDKQLIDWIKLAYKKAE